MELDIMELMSAYADDEFEPFVDTAPNTARVALIVTRKLHGRHRVRVIFLAAAIVLLCAACAVAARTLSYGQFTPAMRTWLELDVTAIPESVEYEQVVEAETARYTDVNHEGRGELYLSAGVSGRSENILVAWMRVSTVTSEQLETLTWLAREVEGSTWYPVEWSGKYDGRDGSASFSLTMPVSDDAQVFSMELCAGRESNDGSAFMVERIGVFTMELSSWDNVLVCQFDPSVEIYDESGEQIAGWLTHAEWNNERLIAVIEYNGEAPDIDEMEEYLAWINHFVPLLSDISIVFVSGEELSIYHHDGLWRDSIYMISVDLPPKFKNDQPVALRVGDEIYPLVPMD